MIENHTENGQLAQLVERLPYKQDVTGSSPVPPMIPFFISLLLRLYSGNMKLIN